MIPFNKPYKTGKEYIYIEDAIQRGKLSGNGFYTKKCQKYLEYKYGFGKCLLTTSCTDALEMAAILIDIKPGDEVIMPSYTFVSTSNAFVLRGARIVFADSCPHNPNIDPNRIEELITDKTKAIVVVHYAGMACDMEKILAIAERNNIKLIEDAAQAVDSYYKGKPLGTFGHLAAFSFHETKNIISGEGGMLAINDMQYTDRAEIIWEKGTNRSAFFRGEIDKYGWVDIGSSFLPSEIIAAFLWAQIENINQIQEKRKAIWNRYNFHLKGNNNYYTTQEIESDATNNAHMYYLLCNSLEQRSKLISYLRNYNIHAVFHYLSLHKSPFYKDKHDDRELPNCNKFAERLVRLPLYVDLSLQEVDYICEKILAFEI